VGGKSVDNKLVPQLGRCRKRKHVIVTKKTLLFVIFQISILSIILLFPVFSQSLLAYRSTLFALCTLFLFGGILVYLTIRLVMVVCDWRASGKHAKKVDYDTRFVPLWYGVRDIN
jgi:hypothetical protein